MLIRVLDRAARRHEEIFGGFSLRNLLININFLTNLLEGIGRELELFGSPGGTFWKHLEAF
jgi:hypothetical protein